MSEIKQNITNELSERRIRKMLPVVLAVLLWMIPDIGSR